MLAPFEHFDLGLSHNTTAINHPHCMSGTQRWERLGLPLLSDTKSVTTLWHLILPQAQLLHSHRELKVAVLVHYGICCVIHVSAKFPTGRPLKIDIGNYLSDQNNLASSLTCRDNTFVWLHRHFAHLFYCSRYKTPRQPLGTGGVSLYRSAEFRCRTLGVDGAAIRLILQCADAAL
ncbi:hypothetical protein AMECASPLE_007856 [Ameca splendens]|uniref:Uncharacterized protein n=1 Tax=Ameca splendens TaxID=208324 RepID=A0ABV0YYD6_9TELE